MLPSGGAGFFLEYPPSSRSSSYGGSDGTPTFGSDGKGTWGGQKPIGMPHGKRMVMRKTDLESVRRAARVYHSNKDAAAALGIGSGSFSRICRENGIETPHMRVRRLGREGRRSG